LPVPVFLCLRGLAVILLYTDFGFSGPYVGEMRAMLSRVAPGVACIDLMHDAPAFSPLPAALLLEALSVRLPPRSVTVAVVDPGVGTSRRPMVARAGEQWYVGPDNGLLAPVLEREGARAWQLPIPDGVSSSFHGRDLFAPAAARLAMGGMPRGTVGLDDWQRGPAGSERYAVIYVDGYGNLVTGIPAVGLSGETRLRIAGQDLGYRRVFGEAEPGELFWYSNSMDRVEIAANAASAAKLLDVDVGEPVEEVG